MASLFGGAFTAVLVQMLRPGSPSLNSIADAVGLRALVAIPRFRNEAREPGQVKIRDPRLYIESIRSLRHAVFEQQSARETKVCLFTSVVPSQGKTLVAMSVARAMARSGVRTLFLEMDLRCPAASKLARIGECTRGVAAVLENRAAINDVLQRDESTGLDMLLAEKHASHALDKLTVHAFSGLMARLRQRYDAIIVDSPPAGLLSDALTLASVADQTVIVTRIGETSHAELATVTRLLRERGANLAGLVLTHVEPRDLAFAGKSMSRYVMGMPAKITALPAHPACGVITRGAGRRERSRLPDRDHDEHQCRHGAERERREQQRERRHQRQRPEPHEMRERIILRARALEEHVAEQIQRRPA